MKNVIDIKKEENLNYILSSNCFEAIDDEVLMSTVIVIHLHYEDTIAFYCKYINQIPEKIKIIFTISNESIQRKIEDTLGKEQTAYKFITKNNRGRDISAFLVAAREEILKYKYVCFLHDKKEKHFLLKEDVEAWVRCLWENMVGSTAYINNVIELFEENTQLGLLVPPTPLTEHYNIAYTNTWYSNFENASELCKRMRLQCDLDYDKSPITIGTVFWAKVAALRKLFEKEWRYEDFDEEPLAEDGTISHAIERIFAYIAQDAGFNTGWVMSERFAGQRIEDLQNAFQHAMNHLKQTSGISFISELYGFSGTKKKLNEFCEQNDKVYIFGAGEYGKRCLRRLKNEGKSVDGFLVSNLNGFHENIVEDIPVYQISKEHLQPQCGIIIAINILKQMELTRRMQSIDENFTNIIYFDGM